jgi:hypothetical protein
MPRTDGAWIAECHSDSECSRLEREHACQVHGLCGVGGGGGGVGTTPITPPSSVSEGVARGIGLVGGTAFLVSTLMPDDINGKKPILPVTAAGAFAGLTLGAALNATHMPPPVAAGLIGGGITGMMVEKAQYDKGQGLEDHTNKYLTLGAIATTAATTAFVAIKRKSTGNPSMAPGVIPNLFTTGRQFWLMWRW